MPLVVGAVQQPAGFDVVDNERVFEQQKLF
jgi:hypothetical protein